MGSRPWSLSLLPFAARRRGNASLAVKQAQKAAREQLRQLLRLVAGGKIVSNGLPYCNRQEEVAIAAAFLLEAAATQSVQIVLTGKHARNAIDALLAASTDNASAHMKAWAYALG